MDLITKHLDIWTEAQVVKAKGGRGRGKKANDHYGIKKLRELILELAVRGKLVEQDGNDEPACALLAKIAEEKARLLKEKKIKKQKELPEVGEDEKPFALPEGWEWTRLGNVIEFVNGYAFKSKDFVDEGVGIVKIGDIQNGLITTNSMAHVEHHIVSTLDTSLAVNKGDMLIAMSGATTGKLGFNKTNETFFLNQRVGKISPYFFSKDFLYHPLTTKIAENLAKSMGSAIPNLSTTQIKNIVLASPPLAEQHRIVAKVDELMILCDQLEQKQTTSQTTLQTLRETVLTSLTNTTNPTEFNETWQRIANNFEILFNTEQSIDQLKQTILQLAVMGKLVPQNPKDEPAKTLIHNLTIERDRWLEDNAPQNKECGTMLKKLKKLKTAIPPFDFPSTWITVNLLQIARVLVDCHNKTAPYTEQGIPIIRTSNIRNRVFCMRGIKYISEETYEFWSKRCPPEPKDIIFTREAPMGEAAIIPENKKYCLGQRTMLIRPMHDFINVEYLLLALTEPNLLVRASKNAVGLTVKHLRVGDVEKINIPLPPLAEQDRIVAKVDEIMTICDTLKSRLKENKTTQVHLANTIVKQAIV